MTAQPLSRDMIAEVRRVAHLARLALSDQEVERFAVDLGRILEYVRQLQTLDVEGVEPTAHAMPVTNVFRADEPVAGLTREAALANAPATKDGLFLMPRILE